MKALLISFLSVLALSQGAESVGDTSDLNVPYNKSIVLERPAGVRRISISNGDIAEAVAVSSTEILLNGKTPGETNLIVWDPKGNRSTFNIHVLNDSKDVDAVRAELAREVGPNVSLSYEDKTAFLRGTVDDPITADRAYNIASTLGKVVNLLRVTVPASAPQILLKVRFATVSRSAAEQFGFNIFSINQKGVANSTTTQFGQYPNFTVSNQSSSVTFQDLLNLFYYRPDLNIGTFIQALEAKNILQILAEPNLLTVSGEQASFLAGGEFPFPTIQGGASGVGQITIQFKEFGIRLNFLPVVTPRGSILLKVTPEVSSLDYSNGLTVNGFSVPGLATRRVQTEVELENQQSFVIAGLLDKQVTEQLNKIPGLANIPVLGKLFESKSVQKNDTELLVVVTPELVRPLPAGGKVPGLEMPLPFGKDTSDKAPRTPGADVTGSPAPIQRIDTLPIEELKSLPLPQNAGQGTQDGKNANQTPASSPPSQSGVPTTPPNSGTVK
ncbi:MAG TPA: pilus assembly protein N-terminal domain-containing protein [Bryobacteraceae bacterium]|nr:pilus assembly protein N-terminal domain-containing protein [Bryobacteraceae bacterium]